MNADDQTVDKRLEETQGCRVVNIGLDGFAECQEPGPKACPYALPFGYAFLCRHPQLAALLENTRKARPAAGGEA